MVDLIILVFCYLFVGGVMGGLMFSTKEQGYYRYVMWTMIIWPFAIMVGICHLATQAIKFIIRMTKVLYRTMISLWKIK